MQTLERQNFIHLVFATHWDREWLFPFKYTQSMLIEMMDNLLEFMEKHSDFKHFHLDGQMVVVEDYLRLRPENRDRLESLIREGRILIGPYYSLLDDSHVLGESIVRNLIMGNKVAEQHGGRMDVGYCPAGFGKSSQIPQILRSVGLDTVIFYRGLRQDRSKLEYIWEGPDGSEIFGLRLTGPMGRAWYFVKIDVPALYPYGVPQRDVFAVHNDLHNLSGIERLFFSISEHETHFVEEKIAAGFEEMEAALADDTESNHLLAMQAIDYGGIEEATLRIIESINHMAGYEKIRLSSLPSYVREFQESLKGKKPTVLKGEFRQNMRGPKDFPLAGSVFSTAGPLKIANRKAELALSRWAEVWDALTYAVYGTSSRSLLEQSWKELLASHAHDGVTGQGNDEVIEDVLNRLAGVKQAADGVTNYALARLAGGIEMPEAGPNSVYLTVFNPSTAERDEVVKIYIDMPFYLPSEDGNTDIPEIWSEAEIDRMRLIDTSKVKLDIRDSAGNPVEYSIVDVQPLTPVGINHPGWGGRRVCAHRYTVWLSTGKVPPLGYKVLAAGFTDADRDDLPVKQSISQYAGCVENNQVHVQINRNGTLDITNKLTGRTYRGGLVFEDGLELGSSLVGKCSEAVKFTNANAEIKLVENSDLAATYEIHFRLKIPSGATPDRSARSEEMVDLPVTSIVTLRKGSARLDIATHVDNRARDHRLRVLFPTGLETEHAWVDQPFDIVRRSTVMEKDDTEPLESPYATQPSVSFVDVNDGTEGLAVLHLGLIEYEVTNNPEHAVALTLLRCFQDLNKNCGALDYRMKRTQNLGEHEFKFAVYPHSGDVFAGKVQQASDQHMLPLKVVQSARRKVGGMKPEMSFVDAGDNRIQISALKISDVDSSLIVRLYNPTPEYIDTKVRFWQLVKSASIVDSLERHISDMDADGEMVSLGLGPKKMITLSIVFWNSEESNQCLLLVRGLYLHLTDSR